MKVHQVLLFISITLISCTDDNGTISPENINAWNSYTTADGLLSNQVTSLFEDSQSNLWVGTGEGIMRYEDGLFSEFPSINAQIGEVEAITEDNDGNIYIGSFNGLGVYDGNNWGFFNEFSGFELGIRALYNDDLGNIWMGTTILGILIFESIDQNPSQIFDNNCSDCNDVNVFIQDPSGDLWIGTRGNLIKYNGSTLEQFTTTDGLPDNHIRSLELDKWGRLWAGTFNGSGPAVFESNQFHLVSLNNGFDLNPILGMAQIENGDLWFGLIAAGIYSYDGAVSRYNSDPRGPGQVTVFTIKQHSNRDIWVGTFEDGLWRFTPNK